MQAFDSGDNIYITNYDGNKICVINKNDLKMILGKTKKIPCRSIDLKKYNLEKIKISGQGSFYIGKYYISKHDVLYTIGDEVEEEFRKWICIKYIFDGASINRLKCGKLIYFESGRGYAHTLNFDKDDVIPCV